MTNEEVNTLLPKWAKEKLEMIDIGQDTRALVIFSIVSSPDIQSLNFGYK